MLAYKIVYILTNIIYIFTVDKLFEIFLNKKDCNIKSKNIIMLCYFIALGIIIFITRLPIIMLSLNLAFLFAISLTYKSSFQKKIFSISLILSIILMIELLSSVSFGFLKLSPIKDSSFNSISVLIFTRLITLVITYLINRYKKSLQQEHKLPKIYYLVYFVILFGSLYLFIWGLSNEHITLNHIIISGIVLVIINIMMIVVDERIYNSIILENQNKLLEQQTIVYENQMEIINQSSENIRLLKHDFKNHLIMLSELYHNRNTREFETYIDTILGNIENEKFANSNNFVIDSIINFKLRSIKNFDVKLLLSINVPISIDIIAHDLTIILGNLLDNSITACEKSNDKILEIKISSKLDNLIILINNSYDGKIICENGDFKTTKFYKDNHGLGIASVKKIIEKYDGDIQFEYTSDIFSTSVIIPY